ncbi:HLJ1_G0021340.mRNA.1.CDS.1 [Saccharomyces cerevisiae]|nr:HLJ1_G0021340.mRNA.1.CDS.1 [Saccharomyces cerevisiae]
MKNAFIPKVTECLISPDARIRQAASYIIGVCAQYAPSTYADVCIPTLDTLVQIVDFPGSKLEENRSSTENASAAIAKILYAYNSNIPNVDTYTANWFKTLPTITDKEAASFNYQFLSQLIENNSPIVCAQSNISAVVDSVIQALNERSLTEREGQTVISSVKKLLGFLPSSDAMAIFNRYPADIMEKVHKWFA